MKQFHIETKNQVTGDWNLYDRLKCRYRLDLSNAAEAEHEVLCLAIQAANLINRKRPIDGTIAVASIDTRIVEVTFLPNQNMTKRILWENGEFCQRARTNEAHTV